jgi:hypothetical protein
MAFIKPPHFISSQLIAELLDIDIRAARERLTAIRKALNKLPGGLVTLAEYCEYEHTSLKQLEAYFIRTRGSSYIPPSEEEKKNKAG